MSRTVDDERKEQAEADQFDRSVAALTECLLIMRLRQEGRTLKEIAASTGRSRRTVVNRVVTLQVLLGRLGIRRAEGRHG